ncbi:hypothetical protein [Moraxella catarrhalis]|uniref:hypothetical protein n=1 Tax=Moraxella catarrhalis TaxID=480 RepID=UPI000EA967D1|nr:hypothetical protein [Moraxella catarrhalis]MPX54828.1 hypothetical protein [Moraxella catarrhalis]MPX80507.1 hypothetical protein [Moraxella catarrhalis]RKM36943.1 hypothetical protein D6D68_02440 [Moraxella catarrhalis]RKM37730.1 hypothetical protein D6E04_07990 [Moraxella catarrhalis]RKM38847.1 hypothetical protein D6D79_05880 [Moraxella catarrhalis]
MTELVLLSKAQIVTADTQTLKDEFAKSIKVTADSLSYMATIYHELQNRGVDLSGLKGGLAEYLPMIASNQIDARLVVEYAGNKTLLSCLAKLSHEQQHALIESPTIKYVTIDENHKKVVENLSLEDVRSSQIFQVFDSYAGRVRTVDEQYQHLLVKLSKTEKPRKNRKVNKIKIKDDYIVVGNYDINIMSVIDALKEAGYID